MKTIVNISNYAEKLNEHDKKLFFRLYSPIAGIGKLKLPDEMTEWVKKRFGSVKAVESQKIMRIDNNITCESAIFNELRAKRPLEAGNRSNLKKIIKEKKGGDFCHPLTRTAEDVFGRVKGKRSVTGSNIAKYESLHGVVFFKKHNPLKFSKKDVADYLKTAEEWIKNAYATNPKRKFPFILWNCLWKSGASIVHGHMQIVLGKNKHFGEIEKLRRFTEGYRKVFKSDYWNDLFNVHKALGLGFEKKGCKIISCITPRKEKEVIIIASDLESSSESLYNTLNAYLKMGVHSFNVGIYLQPLDNSWEMPVIIRMIDRGSLSSNTSDFGGMELFASTNVIASDPYRVVEKVKKSF